MPKVNFYHFSFTFFLLTVFQFNVFIDAIPANDIPHLSTSSNGYRTSAIVQSTVRKSDIRYSGETCLSSFNCRGSKCVIGFGSVECIGDRTDCICALPQCLSGSKCASGEKCNADNNCESNYPRTLKRSGTLTLGSCKTLLDCATNRECFSLDEEDGVQRCSSSSKNCACIPMRFNFCNTPGDRFGCSDGEICKQVSKTLKICADSSALTSSEDEGKSNTANDSVLALVGDRGLNLDSCREDDDCESPRKCLSFEDTNLSNCKGSDSRICWPRNPRSCESLRDCQKGETCARFGEEQMCVSKLFNGEVTCTKNEKTSPLPTVSASPIPPITNPSSPQKSGYTFDKCRADVDCASPRKCVYLNNDKFVSCSENTGICVCAPLKLNGCKSPGDCKDKKETCLRLSGKQVCGSISFDSELENSKVTQDGKVTYNSPHVGIVTMVAEYKDVDRLEKVVETDSPKETEKKEEKKVCIAIKHLNHLSRDQLLYEKDVDTYVFCDEHSNCATPGHMVYFHGSPMMMRTYCDKVSNGCIRKRMAVNSPRWSKRLRIKSESAGLEYTAFSARYETFAEERILKVAIHIGL